MTQAQKDPLGSRKDPKRTSAAEESAVVPIREPDQLEGTLPPTPLRDLLAADGASVYVLSDDASLLATVREAGGEQYPVYPASSWQSLREAVAEQRCGIALLDVDSVPGVLDSRLTELAGLRPALVTLLASGRETADELLGLLSERKIHRLLIKPPTVGITRLLLESSVSRHIELRPQPAAEAATSSPRRAGLARWPSWMLAGGLVIGVLVTVALTSLSGPQDTLPEAVTTPAAAPPIAEQVVVEPPPRQVIAPSAEAVDATAPDPLPVESIEPLTVGAPIEASAPEQLPVALPDAAEIEALGSAAEEIVPDEAAVADAAPSAEQQAVAVPEFVSPEPVDLEAMYAGVEAALIAEDLDAAAALLTELQALAPGASRLGFLSAQIGRERARIASIDAAQAAEAAALAATPSELTSLIGLSRARLDQAQFSTPDGDGALDYYRRALAVDAEAAEVQALAEDLGAAVLTAAEIALAEGRFAEAEILFMEAQELSVADEDLVGLELSLVYARESLARAEQDALLAEGLERLSRGLLFEPGSGSALAAFLEVQRRNPDHPGLEAAFAELEQALQGAAEATLADADWARAEAAIEALSQSGAPLSALELLRAELGYGRTQEAFLAEAAAANELNVVLFEPPVYPDRARVRGIEGWVDLEFVVDAQGQPHEIAVTSAEPEGEFESAAAAAIATYVFEPFELDGRTYERRVALRMRFELE